MHSITSAGRVIWTLSGLATTLVLAAVITAAIVTAGNTQNWAHWSPGAPTLTRTVTVSQPFTSLSVESYGEPIRVTGGAVRQATVTEGISYDQASGGPLAVSASGPPTVTARVSNGLLTLAAPSCGTGTCAVEFTVTVPAGTTVTAVGDGGPVSVFGTGGANVDSGGGPVTATGIAGPVTVNAGGGGITVTSARSASLDSGGGPVTVSQVTGPLTVTAEGGGIIASRTAAASLDSGGGTVTASAISGPLKVGTEGGQLQLTGLTGALNADTGGGSLSATGIAAPTATVQTEGGPAVLTFATSPDKVQVGSGGGNVTLQVPGGPYAVSASTEDGPETVSMATSPSAARTITVDTGGGALIIEPAASSS
jgi:hypothetical protein